MSLEEYLSGIAASISAVKRKIITRLWQEGSTFPRDGVSTSELLKLTGQKYFDRRIRELRDEYGCEIEVVRIGKEPYYRLLSNNLGPRNPRGFFSKKQKVILQDMAGGECQICRNAFESEDAFQADHRIPIIRSGPTSIDNGQAVCVGCNVFKRGICKGCEKDCNSCVLAFPEKESRRIMVDLPDEVSVSLWKHAEISGSSIESCVAEALARYVSKLK